MIQNPAFVWNGKNIRQMIGEIFQLGCETVVVGEGKMFSRLLKIFLDDGKVLATVCYMFF